MKRYIFSTKVASVESRRRAKRGWKDQNGDAQIEYEQLGQFLTLVGFGEAYGLGFDASGIEPNQTARLIIEIDSE